MGSDAADARIFGGVAASGLFVGAVSRDTDTPDARGQPEAFAPRWDVAGPRRYFPMGREAIVEWHVPGRPPAERAFVSLASLRARVECEPVLPPALFVFHCGRCGSTLLGRMLEVDRSNRVLLEPNALQRFLEVHRVDLDREDVRRDLQALVAAYGLGAAPEEKRLVIKLTSTLTPQAALLRACFPAAEQVYLLRDPTEVVASELHGLASFLRPERRAELAVLFGAPERPVAEYSDAEWCAWYVDRNFRVAWRHAGEFARAIDYANHRVAYLDVCNALSTKKWQPADPEMAAVLRAYSKQPDASYSAEADARKVPPGLRDIVEPVTREAYGWWRERLGLPR